MDFQGFHGMFPCRRCGWSGGAVLSERLVIGFGRIAH
jgi:hypothetical protein